jgi:Fe-S cluster assembly iron-binding protein IscA
MLTLTESARDVVRELVSAGEAPEGSGLRIAAEPGQEGSSLSLSLATGPVEGDEVVDEQGTRVFLEPAVAAFLDDKVLDASRHEDHVHFSVEQQGGSDGSG